jgi:hypothetical protein
MRRCAVLGASAIVAVATVVSTEASAEAAPRPTSGASGATAGAALRRNVTDPVIVVLKDQTTAPPQAARALYREHRELLPRRRVPAECQSDSFPAYDYTVG